ncbi:conserved Plasmodium protein, unknown function [Plasmodium sp. gorilla clade G3]|nr:conserved Plasmodium protein, unknown function [Plasmodium sp. gorilla clade G3]
MNNISDKNILKYQEKYEEKKKKTEKEKEKEKEKVKDKEKEKHYSNYINNINDEHDIYEDNYSRGKTQSYRSHEYKLEHIMKKKEEYDNNTYWKKKKYKEYSQDKKYNEEYYNKDSSYSYKRKYVQKRNEHNIPDNYDNCSEFSMERVNLNDDEEDYDKHYYLEREDGYKNSRKYKLSEKKYSPYDNEKMRKYSHYDDKSFNMHIYYKKKFTYHNDMNNSDYMNKTYVESKYRNDFSDNYKKRYNNDFEDYKKDSFYRKRKISPSKTNRDDNNMDKNYIMSRKEYISYESSTKRRRSNNNSVISHYEYDRPFEKKSTNTMDNDKNNISYKKENKNDNIKSVYNDVRDKNLEVVSNQSIKEEYKNEEISSSHEAEKKNERKYNYENEHKDILTSGDIKKHLFKEEFKENSSKRKSYSINKISRKSSSKIYNRENKEYEQDKETFDHINYYRYKSNYHDEYDKFEKYNYREKGKERRDYELYNENYKSYKYKKQYDDKYNYYKDDYNYKNVYHYESSDHDDNKDEYYSYHSSDHESEETENKKVEHVQVNNKIIINLDEDTNYEYWLDSNTSSDDDYDNNNNNNHHRSNEEKYICLKFRDSNVRKFVLNNQLDNKKVEYNSTTNMDSITKKNEKHINDHNNDNNIIDDKLLCLIKKRHDSAYNKEDQDATEKNKGIDDINIYKYINKNEKMYLSKELEEKILLDEGHSEKYKRLNETIQTKDNYEYFENLYQNKIKNSEIDLKKKKKYPSNNYITNNNIFVYNKESKYEKKYDENNLKNDIFDIYLKDTKKETFQDELKDDNIIHLSNNNKCTENKSLNSPSGDEFDEYINKKHNKGNTEIYNKYDEIEKKSIINEKTKEINETYMHSLNNNDNKIKQNSDNDEVGNVDCVSDLNDFPEYINNIINNMSSTYKVNENIDLLNLKERKSFRIPKFFHFIDNITNTNNFLYYLQKRKEASRKWKVIARNILHKEMQLLLETIHYDKYENKIDFIINSLKSL